MRRLLLAGLLLAAPPVAAQAGTMVWSVRGNLPDTVETMAGLSEFELVFTVGTDGARLGTQMTVGPTMAAAIAAIDLTTARFQAVVNAAGDSLSLGVVLPPDLAAQMGGSIGFRLDIAIPDSLPLPVPTMNIDSLLEAADEGVMPQVTNTGRTDTVAGVPCEIWTMQPALDSLPADSMAITMCLAEPSPVMTAINDLMRERVPSIGLDLDEMKEAGKRFFGGRELVPVMMVLDIGGQDVVVRLMSVSAEAPDPSFFTLPEGLQPFPIEMFQGMMRQAMPQDAGDDTET